MKSFKLIPKRFRFPYHKNSTSIRP